MASLLVVIAFVIFVAARLRRGQRLTRKGLALITIASAIAALVVVITNTKTTLP